VRFLLATHLRVVFKQYKRQQTKGIETVTKFKAQVKEQGKWFDIGYNGKKFDTKEQAEIAIEKYNAQSFDGPFGNSYRIKEVK
tara:strand:+ start:115 stop:363 length:249 start_codon:yes stop_codon:yes gene_type:complete